MFESNIFFSKALDENVGVGRWLGGRLAVSVAGTRKVCPDGVDSCGDPFRRSAMCIDQLLTFLLI